MVAAAILISADGRPFSTASCPLHDSEIKAVLARSNPFTHSAVVMRRAALEAVGHYRAAAIHAEDYDLWLRLAERFRLAGLAQPVLRYRVHAGQATSRQLRQQALASLAVRMAAEARRARGHDPLVDVAKPGGDAGAVLHALGVDEQRITSALLGNYISHAYTLARSGAPAAARTVWTEAVAAARRSPGPAAARVCLADPALAGRLLSRGALRTRVTPPASGEWSGVSHPGRR